MKAKSWVAYFVGPLPLLLAGCAATSPSPPAASADPTKVHITVLYDAFGKSSAMQKDWGYAALIEYGGKRILFDTGNNGDILAQNAKAKGIDLSKLDFVVMSHRHGDHMGGMAHLLSVNPKVKILSRLVIEMPQPVSSTSTRKRSFPFPARRTVICRGPECSSMA